MGFQVIPVIDLKGGIAVHAVGGRRDQYRPLRSIWQASRSPVALAAALREGLGTATIYVADLDAIEGRSPNVHLYDGLAGEGRGLWIDAGIRDARDLAPFWDPAADGVRIVVGLETLAGPKALAEIIERIGPDRVVLSLDLVDSVARRAPEAAWAGGDPRQIAAEAIEAGVRNVLLLDLARVGTGRGAGTEDLLRDLRSRHPAIVVTVGGGIRGIEDVRKPRGLGASAVLVGSAIHDGRIGRRELEEIAREST